jgi:hypothetical protein
MGIPADAPVGLTDDSEAGLARIASDDIASAALNAIAPERIP